MQKPADAIVEVTITFFPKGTKVRCKDYDFETGMVSLTDRTWELACREIPEAERYPKENLVGQNIIEEAPDLEFTEDWVGFSFCDVGEGTPNGHWKSGVDYLRQEMGDQYTFEGFHEALLDIAPARKEGEQSVCFLTAWTYWHHVDYWGEHEDGVELVGRLDMNKVTILEEKSPTDAVKTEKPVLSGV